MAVSVKGFERQSRDALFDMAGGFAERISAMTRNPTTRSQKYFMVAELGGGVGFAELMAGKIAAWHTINYETSSRWTWHDWDAGQA
jgi:hypothetical protein